MSRIVGIVGESGRGKSHSVQFLDPKETFIINVSGKDLPFKGWMTNYTEFSKNNEGGNYYASPDAEKIVNVLRFINEKKPEIKNIVIDDFQYIMSTEFMNRATESGWDKFNDIGKHAWDVINTAKSLRREVTCFVTFHVETVTENYKPKEKIKTIGKMLDDKVTLEGLFTVILFAEVEHDSKDGTNKYYFNTQTNGVTTAKSPEGMFPEYKIPNNLQYVLDKIEEYNKG